MVLVILGGLLLGGLLTKFFGTGGASAPSPNPTFTPLPGSTATYAPSAAPTPASTPTGRPSVKPARAAERRASPPPSASASPTASASPSARPSRKPKPKLRTLAHPSPSHLAPVIVLTPTPAATVSAPTPTPPPPPPTLVSTPQPIVSSTPVLITGANNSAHAAAIVRAYIAALARGDTATAAGYLASGLPTETFINPNVSVNVSDLRASRNDDGSFNVTVQIVTSKGSYLASFTLSSQPYGLQITNHSATRL